VPPRPVARFGWIPDLPDFRDLKFSAPVEIMGDLPERVDMREQCPPVYDQGQLGSCTANAIGAMLQFDQKKQLQQDFQPSRLFIYYGEREMEGTIDSDSGAMIRDGIKVVNTLGAPPETDWDYDITKFSEKPPQKAYDDAQMHQALSYRRIPRDIEQMKGCLASGFPFVFGFRVYESFESSEVAETGRAHLPEPGEQALGGHAVMAVGYNERINRIIIRNSWGTGWGRDGYFTLPYKYFKDSGLSSDFWSIQLVE
jgi:C1A family cysteine protease